MISPSDLKLVSVISEAIFKKVAAFSTTSLQTPTVSNEFEPVPQRIPASYFVKPSSNNMFPNDIRIPQCKVFVMMSGCDFAICMLDEYYFAH
jgi:hypothetical protein